jgi:hypothetical protein
VRSRLLEAQILADRYQPLEALALLQETMRRWGRDGRALTQIALLEERLGRYRSAEEHIDEAVRLEPRNRRLLQEQSRVRLLNASRLKIETEQRSIAGLQEQMWTRMEGHQVLSGGVGLTWNLNRLRYAGIGEGESGSRQFGEIGVERRLMNGMRMHWTVASAGYGVGTAGTLTIPGERGRTEIRAEYARPWWEMAEFAVSGGTRDAVEIEHGWIFSSETLLRAIAGLRRYRDPRSGMTTATQALTSSLIQTLFGRGILSLEYIFDLERASLPPVGSNALILSREVHAGALTAHKSIGATWDLSGSFGFAADRLGGRGPFWTADVTWRPRRALGFQLFFDRRRYTQETDRRSTRLGGGLTWRF